ncbi:MAG TPA: DUF58 domain-containing protein [Methylomirabilota bacterium]|nr:DUF58 domain-containing protein [Methylomirabilota bacterium]
MSQSRSNRVRVRFTGRGHLFSGICIALYFSALTSQSGLLLLLIGIVVGCVLVNAIVSSRIVKWVTLEAPGKMHLTERGRSVGDRAHHGADGRSEPPHVGCQEGDFAEPWVLRNASTRPARLVSVRGSGKTLLQAAAIEPKGAFTSPPALQFEKRGVYPLKDLLVVSAYPFGLVEARRQLGLAGEVIVYPALYEAPVVHAAGFDSLIGGKQKGGRRALSGATFAGVRKMEPGDPFRNIHWKSSSKGQGLMVKTFDEEISGRISFIIDTGSAPDREALDNCVRAAGSLMFAALDDGHHVEWIAPGAGEARQVAPFSDGHELLEDLARLDAGRLITHQNASEIIGSLSKRSSVCVVAPRLTEALAAALQPLASKGRVVTVCTAVPGPGAAGMRHLSYDPHGIQEARP